MFENLSTLLLLRGTNPLNLIDISCLIDVILQKLCNVFQWKHTETAVCCLKPKCAQRQSVTPIYVPFAVTEWCAGCVFLYTHTHTLSHGFFLPWVQEWSPNSMVLIIVHNLPWNHFNLGPLSHSYKSHSHPYCTSFRWVDIDWFICMILIIVVNISS